MTQFDPKRTFHAIRKPWHVPNWAIETWVEIGSDRSFGPSFVALVESAHRTERTIPLQHHEIEAWALQVIDRVSKAQPNEDARVELKRVWPDSKPMARQLAAHANAARGAPLLWLVGVDQSDGVVGAPHKELAEWWPAVRAEFDGGIAPELIDLAVPTNGTAVTALYFRTDRPPYAVKNPDGGKIQFEVPWRDGTTTRTADRSELLRILSPLQQLPIVEVLAAALTARPPNKEPARPSYAWSLAMRIYMVPRSDGLMVLPFHRCTGYFEIPGMFERTMFDEVKLAPPMRTAISGGEMGLVTTKLSLTIDGTTNELLVHGPGKIMLSASTTAKPPTGNYKRPARVVLNLHRADSAETISIEQELKYWSAESIPSGIPGGVFVVEKWGWATPRYQHVVDNIK